MADEVKRAFSVICCGKTIANFRNEERAKSLRDEIIDDPKLFLTVESWDPGKHYQYVQFEDEDQEALI